jgi:hypothetical protein
MVDKWASITGVPALYFGDAPPADGPTQIYPPYVVLMDDGMRPEYNFTLENVMEPDEVVFMVYASTLAAVDAIVQQIKYNGMPVSARAGYDFGSLPSLVVPYREMEMKRTNERRFVASVQGTGKTGQRVHGCELRYLVTLFLYGD